MLFFPSAHSPVLAHSGPYCPLKDSCHASFLHPDLCGYPLVSLSSKYLVLSAHPESTRMLLSFQLLSKKAPRIPGVEKSNVMAGLCIRVQGSVAQTSGPSRAHILGRHN